MSITLLTPAAQPVAPIEVGEAPTDVSERAASCFGAYLGPTGARRVTLGTVAEPGFEPTPRSFLALETGAYACVLAPHVLHLVDPIEVTFAAIRRVLAVGGTLCIITAYASSDDAWAHPATVRAFTEQSWAFFPGFEVASSILIPFPDLQLGEGGVIGERSREFEVKRRFMRNVVKEMRVVLRKVD